MQHDLATSWPQYCQVIREVMLDKLLSSSGGYGGKVYRVGVQLVVVGIGFGRINWRASVAEVPVAAALAHPQLPLPFQSRAEKKQW